MVRIEVKCAKISLANLDQKSSQLGNTFMYLLAEGVIMLSYSKWEKEPLSTTIESKHV